MKSEFINSIVDITKDSIEGYSEIRDFITEEVMTNDIVELLGDCSKVVNGLVKLNEYRSISMFKYFLKGFTIGDETEDEKLEKLKKYIDDEKKAIFISQTLQNILLSKSKKACIVLGYMINSLMEKNISLNAKYIILADALTHMFDHDIDNIKFIGDYCYYKICDNRKNNSIPKKRGIYFYKPFKELLNGSDIDKDIMFLTLEKCLAYQLMLKEVEAETELDLDLGVNFDKDSGDDPEISTGTTGVNTNVNESYNITLVGDILYEYINILRIC